MYVRLTEKKKRGLDRCFFFFLPSFEAGNAGCMYGKQTNENRKDAQQQRKKKTILSNQRKYLTLCIRVFFYFLFHTASSLFMFLYQ